MDVRHLEALVLDLADRVRRGEPTEDSRVELKSEWPTDHAKAARRLAGHANEMRGQEIVWIIGLREKEVVGAEREELANWWPSVKKHFDGIEPELLHCMNVPVDGGTVVALNFIADRPPYVVSRGDWMETPWREGTRVRSARRSDLIRMLAPIAAAPELEVIGGEVSVRPDREAPSGSLWFFHVEVYASLPFGERLSVPVHRCEYQIGYESPTGPVTVARAGGLRIGPITARTGGLQIAPIMNGRPIDLHVDSHTIVSSSTEMTLMGPGVFRVELRGLAVCREAPPMACDPRVALQLCFMPGGIVCPIRLVVGPAKTKKGTSHSWPVLGGQV